MTRNNYFVLLILTMVLLIGPLTALGISPMMTKECTAIPWSEDDEYSMIPPAFSQGGLTNRELEIEISWIGQGGEEESMVIHFPGSDEKSLSGHSRHKCPFCSLVTTLLLSRPESGESPLTGLMHRPFTILYRVLIRPVIASIFTVVW